MTATVRSSIAIVVAVLAIAGVLILGRDLSSVEQHNDRFSCLTEYMENPPGAYRGQKCLSP